MKKQIIIFQLLTVLSLLIGCSSSGGDDSPTPVGDDNPISVLPPSASTLLFPDENTECNEGDVVSNTESTVTFKWNVSENTNSYELNVTNLNTNVTSKTSISNNEAAVIINRGVPYEWFVVSKASGTTEIATSAKWKFYNEGIGVENYAPFPADAISPMRGSTLTGNMVSLEWNAADVDNDIEEYEVFFDTDKNTSTSLGVTTLSNMSDVSVVSGSEYYWKVMVKDSQGNASMSEIFEFKVE